MRACVRACAANHTRIRCRHSANDWTLTSLGPPVICAHAWTCMRTHTNIHLHGKPRLQVRRLVRPSGCAPPRQEPDGHGNKDIHSVHAKKTPNLKYPEVTERGCGGRRRRHRPQRLAERVTIERFVVNMFAQSEPGGDSGMSAKCGGEYPCRKGCCQAGGQLVDTRARVWEDRYAKHQDTASFEASSLQCRSLKSPLSIPERMQ